MEILRGCIALASIALAYWVVVKYTKLTGWKRHAIAWLAVGLVGGTLINLTKTKAELAAEAEAKKLEADKAAVRAEERKKQEVKREAEQAREAEAFKLGIAITLKCERAAKEQLTIPRSADFALLNTQLTVGKKPNELVQYNTFTYKNAFNAELEGAYLCVVNTKDYEATKEVTVVSIKLGRP